MAVKPIPTGYASITPYLCIKGAAAAIDYYRQVFNAEERMRMPMPDGKVAHAELQIGGSVIMLADEFPEMDFLSPATIGGTGVSLMLYVQDCDKTFARAIELGATSQTQLQDQFWGDRCGTVKDPYGHVWTIATHIEDVSPEEMARRSAEFTKQMQEGGCN